MRAWKFHVLFAAGILATLGLKDRDAVPHRSVGIDTSVIQLLESNGLTFRNTRVFSGVSLKSLSFDAPTCSRPLQVVPTRYTFEARELFHLIDTPGDLRLFVYIDWISPVEDRLGMFLVHAKHQLLWILGIATFVPDQTMLLISRPTDCHAADSVEWPLVWNSAYRAAIANTQPAVGTELSASSNSR